MDWGRLFFSAYGRMRRQEFWITFLILFAVGLVLGWLPPVGLVILYCSICTRAKRLHDMGRTGWLQVIPAVGYVVAAVFTIYYVLGAIFAGPNFVDLNEAFAVTGFVFGGLTVFFAWIVACLMDLAFLLWIGFSEGDPEENRFGPPVVIYGTYAARA